MSMTQPPLPPSEGGDDSALFAALLARARTLGMTPLPQDLDDETLLDHVRQPPPHPPTP